MAIRYHVGDIIETPNGKVEILQLYKGTESNGRRIRGRAVIKFLETGTVRNIRTEYLKRDYIADYNRPTVYGVGFIGSELKIPQKGIVSRLYNIWRQMLYRVYGNNPNMKKYYSDVTIDPRWHNFTTFVNTVCDVDGYEKWEMNDKGYELDKDIKIKGNKHYSPFTCKFVTKKTNMRDCALRRWHGSYDPVLTAIDRSSK